MYIIKEALKNEFIIKNSKFISYSFFVNNENDIKNHLDELSVEYKDSTHIVYAYKLNDKQKMFDDNEPSGTAALPIMEIINKNNLTNILIVVIRYFGGIKLGAGGLIRAYRKAAKEVIGKTEEYIEYNYYELITNYDNLKILNNITKDLEIIKKDFKDDICYQIKIAKKNDNIEKIFKNTNIKIKRL